MGFRNPLFSANQIITGTLTRVRYRTARTGPRVELQPRLHPERVRLFTADPVEQGPAELTSAVLGSPETVVAELKSGDVGHGQSILVVYATTDGYTGGFEILDGAGNLARGSARYFLDANSWPLPRWANSDQHIFDNNSSTAVTNGAGQIVVDHGLTFAAGVNTTPATIIPAYRGNASRRWVTVVAADDFTITFQVQDAAGVVAATSVTVDWLAIANIPITL